MSDFHTDRRIGLFQGVAGMAIAGISTVCLVSMALPGPPGRFRAVGYAIGGMVLGLGLMGMGWSNLRQARTLAREAEFRRIRKSAKAGLERARKR